ncbi:hypothetical protein CB0940_03341 [Cercospora beticola]|uniref:Xylanolytic transcriptional activator regulatory domain-containing protein n=1 Tax=Cercospora beticola TaxID=122368 RepID=A0A2G5I300_CERBT|nr:hypothetical protein CB0940_03341 [Cercospora beticola]PIA99184.1 hypothetical protein CB0940_03341 [Cercospora beticola]WPB00516.1 hypothetical protein RHO25_005136 [Cercospora beticola]
MSAPSTSSTPSPSYADDSLGRNLRPPVHSMALELTFVNHYGDSAPKRRRLAKACETCRARKKRCIHFANSEDSDKDKNHDETDSADERAAANGSSNGHLPTPTESTTSNARHFISDLNPEATFLQRHQPAARASDDDIGVWVDRREYDALVRQKNIARDEATEAAAGEIRPPASVVKALIDVYFAKVHPILPLLDEAGFRAQYGRGVVPDALVHAICIVAAKHSEAAPHLRLEESQPPMLARDFCRRLHKTVIAALRFPGRYEKITLIRILALTSLHAETADGAEEATLCLVQALHYLQTMGWHLGQQTGVPSSDEIMIKRVFWCLWCLDRLNSCIYGRPITMSDCDIAIEPFQPGESGFPAFEVWVAITHTLNKVISFYRPGVPVDLTGWEDDFPSFEDALDEGKAYNLDRPTMTTLHLYYLVVAVLSHRSRGVKYVRRSTPSYVRQSLASIEINRLMSSNLLQTLLPMPFLSYGISLAMSVSYQHLRQSQLQHQQEDARQDFKVCCQILQKLRRTWSAADVIATIAKKVLDQLEKASDLSVFRIAAGSEEGRNSPHVCTASFWKPHTLVDHPAADDPNADGAGAEVAAPNAQQQSTEADWHGLFEGMDDVFGTYLDPNYPVNLDDFSFVDDLSPLDWNIPST